MPPTQQQHDEAIEAHRVRLIAEGKVFQAIRAFTRDTFAPADDELASLAASGTSTHAEFTGAGGVPGDYNPGDVGVPGSTTADASIEARFGAELAAVITALRAYRATLPS